MQDLVYSAIRWDKVISEICLIFISFLMNVEIICVNVTGNVINAICRKCHTFFLVKICVIFKKINEIVEIKWFFKWHFFYIIYHNNELRLVPEFITLPATINATPKS